MICNLTKRTVLARRPVTALGPLMRGRGMIGRDFRDFDAMVFPRCGSIHTFGMGMPIDVLFLDPENRICALRQRLIPWRVVLRTAGAVAVIELPDGAIVSSGTELGDFLDLHAELTELSLKQLTAKSLFATAEVVMPCRKS